MQCEIVNVGTEIILGDIVNTNAQYLSRRAARMGLDVFFHTAVGDNPGRMAEVFRRALGRSEIVVVSGGLGPTADDLSKEVMADVLGLPLDFDPWVMAEIEAFFRKRGRHPSPSSQKQALVPRGGRVLPNRVGTAPGLLLENEGKLVFLLPGPPSELRIMWEEQVEPILRERGLGRQVIFSRTLRICGLGESVVAETVADLLALSHPTVAPYAKPGEVHLRLTCKAGNEKEATVLIAPVEAEIRKRLGWRVFGRDEESLEEVVGRQLRQRGLTLAVAESCTGGMLGDRITSVPGSSQYFLGGIISYANRVKEQQLGVPGSLISLHGAVSGEVVTAMAEGVRSRLGADLALAISGIAGPEGGTQEKPVGTVWLALATGEGTFTWCDSLRGPRHDVRWQACQAVLTGLHEYLQTGEIAATGRVRA